MGAAHAEGAVPKQTHQGRNTMLLLKACPRCHGDLMLEALSGENEFACLQCGFRVEVMRKPVLAGN